MSDIRLAIFDTNYVPEGSNQPQHPFWEVALTDEHEVVADAKNLRSAMLALVAIKKEEAIAPDVLVVADRLDDDFRYIEQPLLIPDDDLGAATVRRRAFTSLRQHNVAGKLLLPMKRSSGEVGLAEVNSRHMADDVTRAGKNYDKLLRSVNAQSKPAKFIVSHVTRLYLPEHNIRVIGVSDMAAGPVPRG